MKFSEALDEYLEHLKLEPDESDGYTDKAFWAGRKRVRDQLDQFVKEIP